MRRLWPDNGLQPISDCGITISIQRAFFWCAGCINKICLHCSQLAFVWTRPKIKAKIWPSFFPRQFQAKILFNKNVSNVVYWDENHTLVSWMIYHSFSAFIGLSKASNHYLTSAVRGTPKWVIVIACNKLINWFYLISDHWIKSEIACRSL